MKQPFKMWPVSQQEMFQGFRLTLVWRANLMIRQNEGGWVLEPQSRVSFGNQLTKSYMLWRWQFIVIFSLISLKSINKSINNYICKNPRKYFWIFQVLFNRRKKNENHFKNIFFSSPRQSSLFSFTPPPIIPRLHASFPSSFSSYMLNKAETGERKAFIFHVSALRGLKLSVKEGDEQSLCSLLAKCSC